MAVKQRNCHLMVANFKVLIQTYVEPMSDAILDTSDLPPSTGSFNNFFISYLNVPNFVFETIS